MPIDLAQVDWFYVAVLAVFVFVATGIGNLLSFNHRGIASFLSAAAFVALFVAYTYYPHHLPLPTTLSQKTAAPTLPPVVSVPLTTPQRPRNPVTDVTPR